MTTSTEANKRTETSLTRDWMNFAVYRFRPYLGGRRGLIILSVSALLMGGVLSWDWLVAVGLAPLIIAVAPCAVMCALGLCMNRMGGQSCSDQSSAAEKRTDACSSSANVEEQASREPVVSLSDRRADNLADDASGTVRSGPQDAPTANPRGDGHA